MYQNVPTYTGINALLVDDLKQGQQTHTLLVGVNGTVSLRTPEAHRQWESDVFFPD